jgi:hypothetical protein
MTYQYALLDRSRRMNSCFLVLSRTGPSPSETRTLNSTFPMESGQLGNEQETAKPLLNFYDVARG